MGTMDVPTGFGGGAVVERNQRVETWKRFSRYRPAVFGLAFIFLLVICAVFAAWIAPYDPEEVTLQAQGSGTFGRTLARQ